MRRDRGSALQPARSFRGAAFAALTGLFLAVTAAAPALATPPTANTSAATHVQSYSAVFRGFVNPGGAAVTKCRFEYGTTTDYGETVGCAPDAEGIGSGGSAVAIVGRPILLRPGTTYHYRLVAENADGAAEGNHRSFTTSPAPEDSCSNADIRREQHVDLPACMGLEMVSPPNKFQQNADAPSLSVDGSRALFISRGGLENPPGVLEAVGGDRYIATRGATGWQTRAAIYPAQPDENYTFGWNQGLLINTSFDPHFTRWLTLASTPSQWDDGISQVFQVGLDGAFSPLSSLLVAQGGPRGRSNVRDTRFDGASADHSHVFFTAGDSDTAYLDGDPSPSGTDADRNAYVAQRGPVGQPSLALLARDGDGAVWGERCGARLGGVKAVLQSNGRDQGAVSGNGDRVYLSTRPSQPPTAACDSAANGLRILRRDEAGDDIEIAPLFPDAPGAFGECARVAPACDTTNGDDLYQGASEDGTKVYFVSPRQLADSDRDVATAGTDCSRFFGTIMLATGCDLYLYDSERPAGDRLVQVSAGETGAGANVFDGIAAISTDGSHVYFVALGALTSDANSEGDTAVDGQPNLYSFVYDSELPQGEIEFVGTVAAEDISPLGLAGAQSTFKAAAYPVPAADTDGGPAGGSGKVLAFTSGAPLTADDTDGAYDDVFRYDSDSGDLIRVSKAAPGGSDNGPYDVRSRALPRPDTVGTDFAEAGRWVGEDGRAIVLRTPDGLAPDDLDGRFDDYLWRDGDLWDLPGRPAEGAFATTTASLSHDGSDVVFATVDRLLSSDGDTVSDVYVARSGGGFASTSPAPDCDPLTAVCPGPGADPLTSETETAPSSGSGNAVAGPRKTLNVAPLSSKARAKASRLGRFSMVVRTSGAGTVTLTVNARMGNRTRQVARATKWVAGPGRVRLNIRLSAVVRRQLRTGRKLQLTVEVRQPGARARAMGVLLPGVGR